jgi:hypothetical protein
VSAASVAWILIAGCSVAVLVVGGRRVRVPVWAAMVVALILRGAFVWVVSASLTPHDVAGYFHTAGALVLHGEDPLSHMPGREWNFLELMPYVFAGEIKTGLPWVYAAKIAPVISDVAITGLVGRLAGTEREVRALQYALNPLSLLVVALHGQVEPVALAFAMGAVVMAKKDKWAWAGVLVGAAVAAKTWPVLIVLAMMPFRRPRRCGELLAGAAAVPVALLVSGVVFLDTRPVRALVHVVSYTSIVDNWGWGGTLVTAGVAHVGYGTAVGHAGSALVAISVVGILVAFRRYPLEARALAVLAIFLVVTPSFGNQYLLWPLALIFVAARRSRVYYLLAATAWDGVGYLTQWPQAISQPLLTSLSWGVIACAAWVVAEQGGWSPRLPGRRHHLGACSAVASPLPQTRR